MEEKTAFLQIFGDSPVLRVLDFLVVHEEFDYSMSDIAKLAGVGYSTLKLFWPKLENEKVVTPMRSVGKAKMYKLNSESQSVQQFKKLYWTVTKQSITQNRRSQPSTSLKAGVLGCSR